MSEKRYVIEEIGNMFRVLKDNEPLTTKFENCDKQDVTNLIAELNELAEENRQLKQDKFICLDCEHSGYTEIGCLCEKKDHWTDYKTECEDYEELK